MDGLQASRHLRSDETLRHPPAIVLVTAFGREEVREEAERLRLDGFLLKPVTKSMIVDTLVSVFAETSDEMPVTTLADQEQRLHGVRILLVEDNDINQQIAIELLTGAGASVQVANNGREAVEILLNSPRPPPFDLVLMDLQMPEMDGYQATARLRAERTLGGLPIVAMTAHATIEERQRCLSAGMNDHLSKPIDPVLLIETVERICSSTRSGAVSSTAVANMPGPLNPQPSVIPLIEGLNVNDGLARVGGNSKLYVKLLRQFVEQQGPAPGQIDEALTRRDLETARRIAHTVQGVAGNLGARNVQQAAAALEKAIEDSSPADRVASALREFRSGTNALVGRLRAVLPESEAEHRASPPAAALDLSRAQAVVHEMVTHLKTFDPAAGDCLETHRDTLRPLFTAEAFHEFEQAVEAFELATALSRLEQAAAEKGLPPT
jgi:two-component system sensor histidine kinase/response regulator